MKKFNLPIFLFFYQLSLLKALFFNAIYWGTYLKDNNGFPSFQSFAPPKTTVSVCLGAQSIKLGSGDGYLAKLDKCGQVIWSTFIGDYIQCLKLDVQNGKTIIYVAGNISNQSNKRNH